MSQPYPQQPPRPQYPGQFPPPPPQAPAAAPAVATAKAGTSKLVVAALVVGILNLLLTAYLVIVVIRAQSALSELGNAFSGGLGGIGG